jgi:hypothetical protein
MTVATDWHEATIRQLHDLLLPVPAVESLAIVGSAARSRFDAWSDLDVLMVVRAGAFHRFSSSLDWLAPVGEIYAFEWHRNETRATLRLCFADLRRLDVIVTTPDAFAQPDDWSTLLADGCRVLFSRTPDLEALLARSHPPAPPDVSDESFETMSNGFWFKGTVAVQKVVRGDLLVALHLSLEMIQDCCILAMMLRDRETGTTKHRDGAGNDLVAELEATRRPYTAAGILDSIEQSAVAFDRLAGRWSATWREKRGPLVEWVEAARVRPPRPPKHPGGTRG